MHVVSWVLVRGGDIFHQLGTEKTQGVFLFLGLCLGNDDQCSVSSGVSDTRKTNASISSSSLNDEPAWLQLATCFRV